MEHGIRSAQVDAVIGYLRQHFQGDVTANPGEHQVAFRATHEGKTYHLFIEKEFVNTLSAPDAISNHLGYVLCIADRMREAGPNEHVLVQGVAPRDVDVQKGVR